MAKELQISYRSDDGSDDTDHLQRMLQLAGMQIAEPVQGCETCGSSDHDNTTCPHVETVMQADETESLDEEQASYDHGHQDVDEEGHEVDPSIYVWNGPKLPQRIVKGTQGDNPLISEIHNRLVNSYNEFLAEAADRENEDGSFSPLSDPTKPEFDKDPLSGEDPVTDGSHSPMSTISRQAALK
jgi:hypothetical protein